MGSTAGRVFGLTGFDKETLVYGRVAEDPGKGPHEGRPRRGLSGRGGNRCFNEMAKRFAMVTGRRCMIDVKRNTSVFVMDADNAGLQIAPKTRLNKRLNARVVMVVAEMIDGGTYTRTCSTRAAWASNYQQSEELGIGARHVEKRREGQRRVQRSTAQRHEISSDGDGESCRVGRRTYTTNRTYERRPSLAPYVESQVDVDTGPP